MDKSYCTQCKKEVSNDTKQCECGGRTFVFGNVKVEGEKITCVCGNDTMQSTVHMDSKDKATTSYQCSKCGAGIGVDYYRNTEDMMYWGD